MKNIINQHSCVFDKNSPKKYAVITILLALTLSLTLFSKSYAVEWGVQYLQGSDSGSSGYGFTLSEKFSHRSAFSWTLGYSKLNDVVVDWNNNDLTFPIETVDAYITYRFTPHSFNPEATGFSYDLFAGASVNLSENKFYFESLEYEKYFSETNDVNFLMGGAIKYAFTRNTSMQLGVKYYPSYSDFDSVSAAYLGVNYRFGRSLFF